MMSSLICGLRFSHPRKASSPMRVTVFGMLMIVMELHPLKALSPMFVTLYGMLMLVRDLHSKYLEVVDYQLFAVNTVEKWIGCYLWVYGK